MCVVSMVGDHYNQKWQNQPWYPSLQQQLPPANIAVLLQYVPRSEFDALKREVEEMKALLKRAKVYDEQNHEPDCEIDEKMELLRRVAEMVGIDINDVVRPQPR